MNALIRCCTLIGLALICSFDFAAAQDLHPSRRPSPMGMARSTLDDTYVRVVYSRPYTRGRENIFGTEDSGALVPYGKIWRTGANEATEITITGEVSFGGQSLPAGTYSIFTTPGESSWTIHFNSALGLSGTGIFDTSTRKFKALDLPTTDVLVIEAPTHSLEEAQEQFTIAFDATDTGANMCLRWATTEVCAPVAIP